MEGEVSDKLLRLRLLGDKNDDGVGSSSSSSKRITHNYSHEANTISEFYEGYVEALEMALSSYNTANLAAQNNHNNNISNNHDDDNDGGGINLVTREDHRQELIDMWEAYRSTLTERK